MKKLFVLYDPTCAFCCRCRRWLEAQPAYVELCFLAARSPEAECRIPGIEKFDTANTLTVVADDGAVYQGSNAFILCLYALVEFREWSLRLARPALLPFARRFFHFVSGHRTAFSGWLKKGSDEELAATLEQYPSLDCDAGAARCPAPPSSGVRH